MIVNKYSYRKNFLLNTVFIVLVLISLSVVLVISYRVTEQSVSDQFETKKIEILDATIKPYNDFFKNKIPEISFYQGYLDSTSASRFSDTIIDNYSFISSITFYDTQVSNRRLKNSVQFGNLHMAPKAVYQVRRNPDRRFVPLYRNINDAAIPYRYFEEFNKMVGKLVAHIEITDAAVQVGDEEYANVFYNITQNRITYMNTPRIEDLKIFKEIMERRVVRPAIFEQDILSFKLDPFMFDIKNIHPNLYQFINIKPVIYESVRETDNFYITEIPLSGAFADYKLYFRTSKEHLLKEVNKRFLPVAGITLLVYFILGVIAYLIYRNLYINSRLFKLQYDFVNNLTHEFKTPVSVIKIAGNNIKSASTLSDRERLHYGKILDEEADKLNDLMNKLLSFTQIENHNIQIKKEDINLEVFVQNMVDSYQVKYSEFEITYTIQKVKYFKSDPVLLTSIFQNLIDNAYKYSMPKRKALHIDIGLERGNIVFRFADQGIGIPKEEMRNIFKKFYRIQSQYNQQGSVGLGLAFCKELINFMNGHLSVKSKVGVGSEFTVSLPYNN